MFKLPQLIDCIGCGGPQRSERIEAYVSVGIEGI